MRGVGLLWLDGRRGAPVPWAFGPALTCEPRPGSVSEALRGACSEPAEHWLVWDAALGSPDPARVERALGLPGDLWHAGLVLSQGGQPALLDTVSPTWMLNCDPPPSLEATSWRVSLSACLLKTEVLRQLGGVRPEFGTLEAAALEFGHRCVLRGVLTRHVPWLVEERASLRAPRLPFEDELRFVLFRRGPFWARWALVRALAGGRVGLAEALRASRSVGTSRPPEPGPFRRAAAEPPARDEGRVSVLIPTLDRYAYLYKLLGQLACQTVPPLEVIVVDQTPHRRRAADLGGRFPGLPLRVIHLDEPGQCSARNAGLLASRGELVLFLDDDSEVRPELIERHLRNLRRFRADASCGVADEEGAGPLPEQFTYLRASDVFPTHNTCLRKDVLLRTGMFDAVYDRGDVEDADLGTRVYLSGALMVLDPENRVRHYHAPVGGLRFHGARVVRYADSRSGITRRNLPSRTELYLALRYFSESQVREMIWLRIFGTLSSHRGWLHRLAKLIAGTLLLPDTVVRVLRRRKQALELLLRGPRIAPLSSRPDLRAGQSVQEPR